MKNVWFQTNSLAHTKILVDFLVSQGYLTKNGIPIEGFYDCCSFGIDHIGLMTYTKAIEMYLVDTDLLDPDLHRQ